MSEYFKGLKRLEEGIKIPMHADEDGLIGRECPDPNCLGYFKIKPGTGLRGKKLPCHCPYCGHTAGQDKFWTQDQLDYAKSILANEVSKALQAGVQGWNRELQQSTRNSFIKLSMEFKGHSHPIQYYREKQLETHVVCENCTLEYAIYGVFAFCPDCATHNSLQILGKNFDLTEKEVAFSRTAEDKELAERLLEDALENVVAAFDGFGRAICAAFSSKAFNSEQAKEISFQNIQYARTRVDDLFGFDFAVSLDSNKWDFVVRCFQKRHLYAHKMGVVDQEYVKKAKDSTVVVGRKISIRPEEISELIEILRSIGQNMSSNLR